MTEPLRVGVIGLGAMGGNHVRVFGELPEAELVAVADIDEARLLQASGGRSARAYAEYRDLLAAERLDAVSIAVPTRLHAEVALACIERRVPLLVEKPLAAGLDEEERLRAAAEGCDVPLMVGHVERFNPAVQELKRRLSAGMLGRVLQLRARRVGPFYRRERDVGVVHDLATHDIDIFHDLLGCAVEQVRAETQRGLRTEYEDALVGLLRFEDGAVGVLEVNWLTPVKVRELTVLGERGMFVVDYLRQTLSYYSSDLGDAPDRADVPPEVATFPGPGEAPLRAELSAFLRVASGVEPPTVGASEAIAAMRVAEALVEAARLGEAVHVKARGAAR
jgi:UDP-N-acetylglucosamine 3-dehydrogenase